ncbi:MAG TPA: GIY-YIG nuclease family protein [Pirellulales bacterium]|nr:GIY-YIG nuclease family protein [Pirellulales bacterium]
MRSSIVAAFVAASNGFAVDRVVADPELNKRFVEECRARGLDDSAAALNQTLLNLRKASGLSGLPRSKRTQIADQEEFRFAAEMAVRFLERRDGVSLDQVICDPRLAEEFDRLAARIAPGFNPLQYRWAALNLRKTKKLAPEIVARIAPPREVRVLRADELIVDVIPAKPGLYLLFAARQLLYVGETENLKKRLTKHLDHSDNKGLARWLWEFGATDVHLEIQILADGTGTRTRKALELELIRSRQPIFNVKR